MLFLFFEHLVPLALSCACSFNSLHALPTLIALLWRHGPVLVVCLPACMCACLPASLPACQLDCLPACLQVCLAACLPA